MTVSSVFKVVKKCHGVLNVFTNNSKLMENPKVMVISRVHSKLKNLFKFKRSHFKSKSLS